MLASIVAAAIALALLAAWFYPRWRLQRVLARPMSAEREAILSRNIPVYQRMPAELQAQLRRLVTQFLHQKKFVGCAGLEVTEEMRVTIAGQACMLLLNRPSRVYPGLYTVLLYPSAFLVPRNRPDEAGIVTETREDLLGESWSDGRVILSWDHVLRGARDWTDGHNVVLHEFAHQLDSESGSNNGAPYLGHPSSYRSWSQVLSRDFAMLRQQAYFSQQSVLDHYGAQSPAEFFAVATETFFEKPYQLAERHPDLFDEFKKYYRVDPREWVAAPPQEAPDYGFAFGQWQ
ncbi:zinc-dependent peptidase [Pseudoduganella sp. GCM10020061]|uniref:M90 family metallopeptidase n=1 Tax=Pseudoduganella sp. GCM10020061 TaxID=3317345 RepID=UPI0036382D78